MRQLHALIASSVAGDRGERPSHTAISSVGAFEQSIDGPGGLREIVERRRAAIRNALAAQLSKGGERVGSTSQNRPSVIFHPR